MPANGMLKRNEAFYSMSSAFPEKNQPNPGGVSRAKKEESWPNAW